MPAIEIFFDSNVLLYLASSDSSKASRSEDLLAKGGNVSVQVLNELAQVTHGKFAMAWPDILEFIGIVRATCQVHAVTEEIHLRACEISSRYRYSVFDSAIIASALQSGCTTLFSEDLHADQKIDRQLTIRNPFR